MDRVGRHKSVLPDEKRITDWLYAQRVERLIIGERKVRKGSGVYVVVKGSSGNAVRLKIFSPGLVLRLEVKCSDSTSASRIARSLVDKFGRKEVMT